MTPEMQEVRNAVDAALRGRDEAGKQVLACLHRHGVCPSNKRERQEEHESRVAFLRACLAVQVAQAAWEASRETRNRAENIGSDAVPQIEPHARGVLS